MTSEEIAAALCAVRSTDRVLAALWREEETQLACLLECLRDDLRAAEQVRGMLALLSEVETAVQILAGHELLASLDTEEAEWDDSDTEESLR